ncbi:MAG TPA: TRAP transporter small permease [Syntrophorhabdaceae bacterium]|nr:TRAP transporter small permease [Syntrophorhabdaceae bacterium]
MERLERITKNICKKLELVGVAGYLIMVLVNIIDVVGSKFFKWPLPGAFEVTSFAQVIAIALTIPLGLFLGFHLSIDFIFEKLPKTPRYLINIFVSAVLTIFFVLVFLQALEYGYSLQISEEIGSVSKIPLFPFAYVIAVGAVPVILYYIISTVKSIKGR